MQYCNMETTLDDSKMETTLLDYFHTVKAIRPNPFTVTLQ